MYFFNNNSEKNETIFFQKKHIFGVKKGTKKIQAKSVFSHKKKGLLNCPFWKTAWATPHNKAKKEEGDLFCSQNNSKPLSPKHFIFLLFFFSKHCELFILFFWVFASASQREQQFLERSTLKKRCL
jgi:hypothetical protein